MAEGDSIFTEDQMEALGQLLDNREKAKAKKAARNEQPKNFGDFLDAVADAVLDRAESRAAERRAATEANDDEEPSRGEQKQSALSRFWNGEQS